MTLCGSALVCELKQDCDLQLKYERQEYFDNGKITTQNRPPVKSQLHKLKAGQKMIFYDKTSRPLVPPVELADSHSVSFIEKHTLETEHDGEKEVYCLFLNYYR